MKLDEHELDYVKYFIQVKGYHQYEVLAEILDHFVLVLQEQKEEHPNVAFEELVNDAYATDGKLMFKEINRSTKSRITKKYNRLFLSHLVVFLHYEYVLAMAVIGFLLYHLQSLLQNVADFLIIHYISTALIFFFKYKFTSATEIGNPKFMSNKLTKRYGLYLLVVAYVIFRILIEYILNPISYGFNMYYLISTVVLIVQGVILYSLVRTARIIVEESEAMEETYQVLK